MPEKKIRRGPELNAVVFRASSHRCAVETTHKAADLFGASHTTLGLCITEYLSSIKDGLLYNLSSIKDGLGNDE